MQPEMYPTRQEQRTQWRKQINTVFNEVRQFAYVLGARERERFYWFKNQYKLIQRDTWGIFLRFNTWGLYPLFIATESQDFRKPWLDSAPNRKGVRIQKGQPKRISSSTGRSTNPCLGRPAPTESSALSVGRPCGRPPFAMVDRTIPVHVVHTGRPCGRPAFSTGRPGAILTCFNALFLLLWFPIFVLSASISSIPTTLYHWSRPVCMKQ